MQRFTFRSNCPGCNQGNILWKHDGCEGTAIIDKDEYVHCENCGSRFRLKDLSFNCSTHTFRYTPFNSKGLKITKWPY